MKTFKAAALFALGCVSGSGAESDIRVISTTQTNADNTSAYAKDVFTRDGQTNLIRITKINAQGIVRIYHFYHSGQLVGNFVASHQDSLFNTEAGPYCMSLKYGPDGEISSARIGDKQGVLLDEFSYTDGVFSPVDGPLRQNGLMKPKFGSELEFSKGKAR